MTEVTAGEDPRRDAPGGHLLPARFAEHPLPRPARRRRPGLVLGIAGAAAALTAVGALQLTANLGYDDAEEQYRASAATTTDVRSTVESQNDELLATADAATLILSGDSAGLIDAASAEALHAARTTASEVADRAAATLREPLPSPSEKPSWFWELFGTSAALHEERGKAEDLSDRLRDDADDIMDAAGTVSDTGIAALTVAASNARAMEPEHAWARNDAVIALRAAADDTSASVVLDDAAVGSFAELQAAAAALVESERAELAEKAGPLYSTRLEVEAFARSIAPGVLIEFDWAPVVNGYGGNGSMGGYTTWWWDEPGRAVIQLSDSVAEQWPADRSKALVVHEVGHAISVKCADMYDASTQDSIEKWATAWAISMGYTDDANGVWAYGYPPQSYIDAAAGCR